MRLTGLQAYAVTKAAQIHLVKCLADIMAPKVRVNCVIPGMIMTVRLEKGHGGGRNAHKI